jgi:hypothetical protein
MLITDSRHAALRKRAILLLTILLAQPAAFAKVVEDSRYQFRADLPGVLSDRVEESDGKRGPLAWRMYTSHSPAGHTPASYSAAVKVFETDSTDVRVLFAAGENDANQSIGVPLMGRLDGTFGADKLPSLTLSYQSGRDGAVDMLRATVLLVVKGTRLYVVTFASTGAGDHTAVGKKFFQSFEILK